MTHYSNNPNAVRVDFFKASGKWYATHAVWWPDEFFSGDWVLRRAFAEVLRRHLDKSGVKLEEMTAVCLDPYHANAHPVMLQIVELATMPSGPLED